MEWLEQRTIFKCRHGSHAYGTNQPGSDLDIKGIAIPPREYILGAFKRFEQAQSHSAELDQEIFDLRKFVDLAADCNPNMIEILFVDQSDWMQCSDAFMMLYEIRDAFLSRVAKHRFSGYAIGQLKKIQSHRTWLLDPPRHKPERAEFGLPEHTGLMPKADVEAAMAMIRKQVDRWDVPLDELRDSEKIAVKDRIALALTEMKIADQTETAARALGMTDNLVEAVAREKRYQSAMHHWTSYQQWLKTRNPKRLELEQKSGYDTKHGMHLVRLMRMAREILTTGQVLVRRPDAAELLEIRNGSWSYEKLLDWAQTQDKELGEIYKTSPLPRQADREKIDAVVVKMIEAYL